MSEDNSQQQSQQIEDLEIQSSAYVNSQSLLSTSMPSSPVATSNVVSKKSSKSKLNGDQEDSADYFHYKGTMERFFQSEVRPVFFGGKNDAFLLLKTTVVAGLLVNLFGILVYMQYDDVIPQNPTEHHPHGILKLLKAFESAFSAYCSDGQIVVGWMLSCWFLGYNVISAVIWWQFERNESNPPDDYEIIPSYRLRRQRLNSSTTNILETRANDPSADLQAYRKQQQQQQQSNEPQNPFDKSVVVISMPDGDFSVGKRQKNFNV